MAVAILIGALGGGAAAVIAGFIAAIFQLQMKRVRNNRRVKRGQPPYRDCVLVPWHKMCPVLGVPGGGVLAIWLAVPWAIAIGGLAAPAAVIVLSVFLLAG